MWSAHFFVTHIQTEKMRSWNGSTVHVCCFMLAHASTKYSLAESIFASWVQKTAKKIFISWKIHYQGHSLAEVSLYSTRKLCNSPAVIVSTAQSSLFCLSHDMRTWKPAPPPCWETQFGSGGAQLLIRYLPSWYHAKSSLNWEMHWTVYPMTLHESLSPAETSSCLWVGNQWQMQLMSQQLTVVNAHSKAPQILSQLYLLLFYHLYLFGVSVTDVFTISSLWCFCPWKKFSFFTALSVCCSSH